jgi:hypothetical protein
LPQREGNAVKTALIRRGAAFRADPAAADAYHLVTRAPSLAGKKIDADEWNCI